MFTNFTQVKSFFQKRNHFGIKPGLYRMRQLLRLSDHPEKQLKAVHIAGTNGKGSTIQYMKSALMENGYQVGVFSSPSLDGIVGHMVINNEAITPKQLISLLNKLYPSILYLDEHNQHPTRFEIITVLAFMFFQQHADIALIEAGMGGKDDTTNCIDPQLSVITNVDYDHMQFLGDTLTAIADHKAGIIKRDRPVIIGDTKEEALQRIKKVAQQVHSPVYQLGEEFTYSEGKNNQTSQRFIWSYKTAQFDVNIQQKGNHQIINCSVAIMALIILKKQGIQMNLKLSINAIASTLLPSRFEQIYKNPSVIVDGAHNVSAIHAFIQTMEKSYSDTNKTLVFAAFKDKDIPGMLAQLTRHFSTIILTTFDHPRAASLHELKSLIDGESAKIKLLGWNELQDQFQQKLEQEKDTHYFFTGSLHFIQAIKKLTSI